MQVVCFISDFGSCYLTYLYVHNYPFVITIGIGQDEFLGIHYGSKGPIVDYWAFAATPQTGDFSFKHF